MPPSKPISRVDQWTLKQVQGDERWAGDDIAVSVQQCRARLGGNRMWPFKKTKSKADLAIEWMPRAIEVAALKWVEFHAQPFTQDHSLTEQLTYFVVGLEKGLEQWAAFKNAPSGLILLIAAKGVEKSHTHTAAEIEEALGVRLPKS